MPKGFVRTLFRGLPGSLLLLGLAGAVPLSRPSPHPTWWEIRLTTTVKGGYVLKGGGTPVSGEYTCRALWEGRLELDSDDFLLYHLKTEIQEWRLEEKARRPEGESVLGEKDTDVKPAIHLNYVLNDGPDVEVDFDLMGVPVPLHSFPVKVALEFPSSGARRSLIPGSSYSDFITKGSNRVVIPRSDLLRSSAQRSFSWKWRRDKRVAAGAATCLVTEHHAAEAVVSFIAH
jgi:hypothetical protein